MSIDLKDIMAISGKGGLFKFIAQGRSGVIVEGLEDKKRLNASHAAKISSLEDISVYTHEKDVSLGEVMYAIYQKENGGPGIDHKADSEELKTYFLEVVPEYDQDRVYVSDIKKIIHWYNILQKQEMLQVKKEEKEEKEEKTTDKTEAKQQETKKEEARD